MADNEEVKTDEQTPPVESGALEDKSLKELKEMLVSEFDFMGADTFTTKAQVISILTTMRAKKAKDEAENAALLDQMDKMEQKVVMGVDAEGKKVALIENPTAPTAEDKAAEKTDAKRWEGKAAAMKAHLAKQPKVQFLIPLGFGEKRGAYETVIMNGYRLNIMKGVLVELPRQVAELLAESYQMTIAAGQEYLLDRNDAVKEVLG